MVAVNLDDVSAMAAAQQYLATVATTRADGTVQASLVNAGILQHPLRTTTVVGFVAHGRAKLSHLRSRPAVTLLWRSGWQWATVEGRAELAGPTDPLPGVDGDRLRQLLRDVFRAAGGRHDDWATYDRVMAEQQRVAVLVTPHRIYGNA